VSNKYGNISFEFVLIIPGNYAPDCLAWVSGSIYK
jgi:hypothetical protein